MKAAALADRLALTRTRLGVPALGAALIHAGALQDVAVVGVCRRGSPEVALADHAWHIGSCGKSMTAALYARLVEQGHAEWGASLPSLFPDFAETIDAGWSAITIDDLFLCRSGLPADLDRARLRSALTDPEAPDRQRTRTAAAALSRPPRRPGRFVYSNLGYTVAGAAIERITGTAFERALATELLEPLGIDSGGFGPPPDMWGHAPRLQLGGLCVGTGRPMPPDDPVGDNPAVMSPAGRLHLTIDDWARFHVMIVHNGGDILSPDSIRRLVDVPAGARMSMGWAPARYAGATLGMQGSNTYWVATALANLDRRAAALVITNDGRTRNMTRTAALAADLLTS